MSEETAEHRRRARAALIARRLMQLRKESNLSQEAVGNLLGNSQATVSRWEDPDSLSTPAALECAELASHYGVSTSWILGESDYRSPLPVGEALIDQELLDAFGAAGTEAEIKELLQRDLSFGTIWVQLPGGVEIISLQEANQRVRAVDRHVRAVSPALWQEWARLVIG